MPSFGPIIVHKKSIVNLFGHLDGVDPHFGNIIAPICLCQMGGF